MSQADSSIGTTAPNGKTADTAMGAALRDATARKASRPATRPGTRGTPRPAQADREPSTRKIDGELPPITLAMTRSLCPNSAKVETVSARYGLAVPPLEDIADAVRDAILAQHQALGDALNERATDMLFQRIAGSYVGAAHGAGTFYQAKVDDMRKFIAQQHHDRAEGRDEYQSEDGRTYSYSGLATRLDGMQDFVAEICMQAYATLATAEGACEAYSRITGKAWLPYDRRARNRPSLDQQARDLRTAAFD